MIPLHTPRQYVSAAAEHFFPYVELLKKTKLANVAHHDARSDEYLSAVAINCILAELQTAFHKKLHNTKAPMIKFEFTDAQGIVLFKTLCIFPTVDKIYLQMIVSSWLQQLDQEMILIQVQHQSQMHQY